MDRVNILGINVDSVTLSESVGRCEELALGNGLSQVVTLNPEMVMGSLKSSSFLRILEDAELIIPDGHGIIWGAERLGTPLKEQVPGIELFKALLKRGSEKGYSIYLYGAAPEVVEKTVENIKREYPGIKIAGYSHGYIKGSEVEDLLKTIDELRPDFLFVALGSPKQEQFIGACKPRLSHGVAIGVGGSFDVLSGSVKRAPKWIRKIHMEWLYRSLRDPSRLKRIFVIPKYMRLIKKEAKKS